MIRVVLAGLAIVIALSCLAAPPAVAEDSGIERLYILDCGVNAAKDQSRWSPGINVGRPIEFSDNCYLIRHAKGLLLWDTGIPDAVAAMPDGLPAANGTIVLHRTKTLIAQLDAIGVKPADITYVAISHTHGDHVGNVGLFPSSTVLIQRAEYEWALGQPVKPGFVDTQRIEQLSGDRDVFGDGSVVIFSTPGHTPGHQSLLVVLPKTGAIVLSGDAVHFRENWDARRVPTFNTSREQTLASMERIASVLKDRKAQLWINHDQAQSRQLRYAPEYYE